MKAILLAAGLGTRLKPITDSVPKPLVQIQGRPLLDWWMELLTRHGIDELLVNTHHFPEQIESFVDAYSGPVDISLSYEPELLGSAGTLWANRSFVESDDEFAILYGDNLTSADLSALRSFHHAHPTPLTVGLFHTDRPTSCGIASLSDTPENIIVEFEEKPARPKGNLASGGIFIARPELFNYLRPVSAPWDIGTHVMPDLVGVMNGVLIDGYLIDIGTHENLAKAEREWQGLENPTL